MYYVIRSSLKKTKSLDCQSKRIENSFSLTRVGITGVRKPVVVHRGHIDHHLTAEIDVFVDLPSTQRGSHMSPDVEGMTAVIEETLDKKGGGLGGRQGDA